MSFINKGANNAVTIDAILTAAGREALANGTFVIDNFKLGDDEVDYALANSTDIESLPIFECFYDSESNLKYNLIKDSGYYTIISNFKNWEDTDSGCGIHAYISDENNSNISTALFEVELEVLNNGPFDVWMINGAKMTSSKMILSPLSPNQTFMVRSSGATSTRQLRVTIKSINHESSSITHILTSHLLISGGNDGQVSGQ